MEQNQLSGRIFGEFPLKGESYSPLVGARGFAALGTARFHLLIDVGIMLAESRETEAADPLSI